MNLFTKFILLSIKFCCLYLGVLSQEDEEYSPIVTLSNGKVRGFTVPLHYTGVTNDKRISNADIFLGIPYAQPPIDDLRLEVSV